MLREPISTNSVTEALPRVCVIVPTLNEEKHIEACITSIEEAGYPQDRFELLIVDGGSSDKTVAVARSLAERFGNIRVLHNPGRIQSCAVNIGIRAAGPECEFIIRADAHSIFPPRFVRSCVDSINRHAADLIVFVAVPIDQGGCLQKAVACAQSTPLGVGNSHYRLQGISQPVEHGFHGCFRRSVFDKAGLYDESFTHNEDAELSYRIRQAGGQIFLDHTIQVSYVPRGTFGGLVRQYHAYGRGRARNILKHQAWPRLRQIAPVGLVLVEALLLVLLPFSLVSELSLAAVVTLSGLLGLYATLLTAAGVGYALTRKDRCLLLLPAALAVMHHTWGFGFAGQFVSNLWQRIARPASAPRPTANGSSTLPP
jgi:succinoglycan biosynthesis protein ExoA